MDGLANNTVYLSDDRPLQQSRTCKVDNAKEMLSKMNKASVKRKVIWRKIKMKQ